MTAGAGSFWLDGGAIVRLMEDIPNSIRNTMGIVADVALLKLNEDYEKLSVNLGKRMPVLESESDYFRVTLPNLLYGFTDEQLVAAVDNSSYGVPKNGAKLPTPHHDTYHDAYHDTYHDTYHDETVLKHGDLKLLAVISANGEMSSSDLRLAEARASGARPAPAVRAAVFGVMKMTCKMSLWVKGSVPPGGRPLLGRGGERRVAKAKTCSDIDANTQLW